MIEPSFDDITDLTPDEIAKVKGLQNPDATTSDNYTWSIDFQREILSLLLHDRVFLLESMALIKPSYFTDENHIRIASILFDHFSQYKVLPNRTQLRQELADKVANKKEEIRTRAAGELIAVLDFYKPGLETREHYRDRVVFFAKSMAMKNAWHKAMEVIKKNPESYETWAEVAEIVRQVETVDISFDVGLDYFNTAEERYARRQHKIDTGDIFSTGFEALDSAFKNGGLLRGEMIAVMGGSGVGKSLGLVAAALANLAKHKRVLYISLEIDQDAVADRFDAQLADPEKIHGIKMHNLLQKKEIVFEALEKYVEDYEDKQLMVIKRFAPGTLDTTGLRAYFSQVTMRGFRPDLVIVDYVGEMKDFPGVKTHESRYMIVRDLRGFAVEENVCVMTALQPNKSGATAVKTGMVMDEENLGDSFAQIKPLDAFWSLNQTVDEKGASVARCNVPKVRDGKSRFGFYLAFDYDNLSMKEISLATYDARMKKYLAEREETITDRNVMEIREKQAREAISKGKKVNKGDAPLKKQFSNDGAYDSEDVAPSEPPPELIM